MTRHSKRSLEGRLLIDHRASPGLTPEFCKALGIPHVGEGQVSETPTLTCQHCNTMFLLNPLRTRERAYCAKCDGYVCDGCDFAARQPDYSHMPFEQLVDTAMREADRPQAIEQRNMTLALTQKDT